jgi:hypothetical protein
MKAEINVNVKSNRKLKYNIGSISYMVNLGLNYLCSYPHWIINVAIGRL